MYFYYLVFIWIKLELRWSEQWTCCKYDWCSLVWITSIGNQSWGDTNSTASEHYQEILLTHNILVHYECKVFTSLNLCTSCELVQLFATVHLVLHYTKESFGILWRGKRWRSIGFCPWQTCSSRRGTFKFLYLCISEHSVIICSGMLELLGWDQVRLVISRCRSPWGSSWSTCRWWRWTPGKKILLWGGHF